MCFSATASFATSFILLVAGVQALKKVKNKSQYFFASIPLLFAIQQACEGILWIVSSQTPPGTCFSMASYGFLFFAFILWPIWIPLSMYMIEKNRTRKKILGLLQLVGIMFSAYMVYMLIQYGVTTTVNNHVMYTFNTMTTYMPWALLIYCIPVCLPFFVSSNKRMWIYGLSIIIALAITYFFWYQYLTSIWCFFAAFFSFGIVCSMEKGIRTQ